MSDYTIWDDANQERAVIAADSLRRHLEARRAERRRRAWTPDPIPGSVVTTNDDDGGPLPAHDARVVWWVLGVCAAAWVGGVAFLIWWLNGGAPWR
jgi:hypothetical protein